VSIRRRVFIASATTNIFAISMIFFVFGIKDYIIFNYTLFLLADVSFDFSYLSIHKLWVVTEFDQP